MQSLLLHNGMGDQEDWFSAGSVQELTNPLPSISNTATLNKAKAAYDAVIKAGGKFNQGPILHLLPA